MLSGGTDGEDGPTDAAGAVLNEEILAAAKARRLNPREYLARYDAYHFFAPLGMKRTITSTRLLNATGNYATPHSSFEGTVERIDWVNWDTMAPAGGIISSANDMARWLLLQLGGGELDGTRVFSESAQKTMWTPHNVMSGPSPGVREHDTHFRTYALGWSVSDFRGRFTVGHGGAYDGMFSQVWLMPEERLGIVVLTNCDRGVMAPIVDRIRELGWQGVVGNTDEMLFRPESLTEFSTRSPNLEPLLGAIEEMAAATREALGEERLAWLRGLPRVQTHGPMALVHASPESPWRAPRTAMASNGGSLLRRVRRLLAKPGSGDLSVSVAPFILLVVSVGVALAAWSPARPPQKPVPAETVQPVEPVQRSQTEPSAAARFATPYRKWLDEDVAYIVTPEEKAAFGKLRTDEEREEFIERFWERRNPVPGLAENQFKMEHYRRIAYANHYFGAADGRTPGWKTARGRFYIIYGPPDEIDDHSADPRPYQIWRYRYIEAYRGPVEWKFYYAADPGLWKVFPPPPSAHFDGEANGGQPLPGSHVSLWVHPGDNVAISIPLGFSAGPLDVAGEAEHVRPPEVPKDALGTGGSGDQRGREKDDRQGLGWSARHAALSPAWRTTIAPCLWRWNRAQRSSSE